ncbi:MAG: pseudouridine synthase, partial [Phycisphaeraceae bacterium]|nr:pseudouridine synthase [Phycisphaeraceae bacterium]
MSEEDTQPDPEHLRPGVPGELSDNSRGPRLQKAMARAGVASRRDCEQMVLDGRVTVNGQPVTELPAWVDPVSDRICVDGRELPRQKQQGPPSVRRTHVAVHKPRGVISTTDDPRGRKTVVDLVDLSALRAHRIYPVGRLDADSSGLMILTNDGQLANRLMHPRYEVEKKYEVITRGELDGDDFERLKQGVLLAHKTKSGREPKVKRAAMAEVRKLGVDRDRSGEVSTRL